ncbi:MAG: hypothetical protein HY700_03310 [Gemmatimonadetes bacterium]|nr:hypothetical protein [Gemmatimonadota bacterium]
MNRLIIALCSLAPAAALAAQHSPGAQGSSNVTVVAHLPLAGELQVEDIEIEQELSRPYAYVTRSQRWGGFHIIDLHNPKQARILYSWSVESPEVHKGSGGTGPAYVKSKGRYYFLQAFQFQPGGPDVDLGAVVFDVTGLPDTRKIREIHRLREPALPGGFHEVYAYKHSSGAPLVFAVTQSVNAHIYDIDRLASGDPAQGLVGKVPVPPSSANPARGWHDFYVGYDPSSHQDRMYGAGAGGYYVFDVTDLTSPRLLASVTGVAGMNRGHTFTPDPTGRFAVIESEYKYAPLRIVDLKPALEGQIATVSRPIGAWTSSWDGNPHNHEVRWPYVFVAAYEDGMYAVNLMDPTNPYTVGFYDTYDGPANAGWGNPPSYQNGADGVDVRNADGLIVISDIRTGFWAFHLDGFDGWNGHQWGVPNVSSAQDWDRGPEGVPTKTS